MKKRQFLLHAAFWGGEIPAAQGAPAFKFLSQGSPAFKFLFLGAGSPLCCLMRRGRSSTAKALFRILESWNGFGGKAPKAHRVPTPCHGQGHFPLGQVAPSLVIGSNFKEVQRNKSS